MTTTNHRMPENGLEQNPEGINKALEQIAVISQKCSQMGGNDFEVSTLKNLEESVRNRMVDPAEAVRQAQAIIDSKQAYH